MTRKEKTPGIMFIWRTGGFIVEPVTSLWIGKGK